MRLFSLDDLHLVRLPGRRTATTSVAAGQVQTSAAGSRSVSFIRP